ncbi:MAG TPA: 2Fe-2S iron-sulfur cluster-binding protein [Candidatus Acidoferrum sp.]|nr:2Fe-2S iron-sulfur cluster-binding protein [Candidatus Acidoferrum sp.]
MLEPSANPKTPNLPPLAKLPCNVASPHPVPSPLPSDGRGEGQGEARVPPAFNPNPSLNVKLRVNGKVVSVSAGAIVAAAIAEAGVTRFRTSVTGLPRGPLCGMGICMECCVTINGRSHCRSCQTLCQEGMEVLTDE